MIKIDPYSFSVEYYFDTILNPTADGGQSRRGTWDYTGVYQ